MTPGTDADEAAPWFEASVPALEALMASGALSSVELTEAYLDRIGRLDPLLHAVIETNPAALEIAARRDAERRAGRSRGPLHGIPVLLKDNIATNDAMQTTAGSLALVGSRVPRDAAIVTRLRAAGAVVLGKANLSEWANFRGLVPKPVTEAGLYLNGWSARGGFTRNPYDLAWDPCGSSSGSAVAAGGEPVRDRGRDARPTDRSSARPGATRSSASSRRSGSSPRPGSSPSLTARTRRVRWSAP